MNNNDTSSSTPQTFFKLIRPSTIICHCFAAKIVIIKFTIFRNRGIVDQYDYYLTFHINIFEIVPFILRSKYSVTTKNYFFIQKIDFVLFNKRISNNVFTSHQNRSFLIRNKLSSQFRSNTCHCSFLYPFSIGISRL